MAHGRYKAVRQRGENKPFPPLDPKRVKLIDDKSYLEVYLIYLLFFIFQTPSLNVLELSYNKTAPQVKRQANQKCSDILTKRLNKK